MLTPAKKMMVVAANLANQRGTMRQIHCKVKDSGVEASHAPVFRWLRTGNAVPRRVWIKPPLTFDQIWHRLLFVVNQVDTKTKSFPWAFNTVHVHETWFYLMFCGGTRPISPKRC